VLRAWERRYGLFAPRRTDGGLRLYAPVDVQRVRAMQALIESGLAPAEAARRVLDERSASGSATAASADLSATTAAAPDEAHVGRLLAAIEGLDGTLLQHELDDLLARLSISAALETVVLPTMSRLGVRSTDGGGIAREHLFTNVLRGRLAGLSRSWDEGDAPRILLACVEGELHDLPLLMLALALRERGWRIVFLGSNTPGNAIEAALSELRPTPVAVVLSSVSRSRFSRAAAELGSLSSVARLLLAGRGATSALAGALGGELLEGDPVSAARTAW
jgi:DNA-binding transcriptional MerR regulator